MTDQPQNVPATPQPSDTPHATNHTLQRLRVASIEPLTADTWRYRLVSADGTPLAPFQAGQFINLFFQIGGSVTSRPYSIASTPRDATNGFYDLCIFIHGAFTSSWLGENVQVGSTILGSVPRGHFTWTPDHSPHVVGISGGLSLTPLLSLAKAAFQQDLPIDVTLLCGWTDPQEAIAVKELRFYAAHSDKIKVDFFFEQDAPDGAHQGLVNSRVLRDAKLRPDSTFFCCGPQAMYEAIAPYFLENKIPAKQIIYEVPGEIHEGDFLPTEPTGFRLRMRNYGVYSQVFAAYFPDLLHEDHDVEISVRDDESLLKGLERAGFLTKARCRSGNCEACVVKLISGDVFIPEDRLMKEISLIKLCSSFPLSNMVIDFAWESIK